jgi:hypothetical protein
MHKYYLKLGAFKGSSTDPLHFGWLIVEKFILNFDRRGPVSSSPHLRPSDIPDLPFRNSVYVVNVANEKELVAELARLKHDGKLPVVVAVFAFEVVGLKESYTTPRSHLVTIDDFDPKTGAISIGNQWGR